MKPRSPRSRGVTLIELLVSVGVASFVMIGISSAFIAMARYYQTTSGRRDAQAGSRLSTMFIEDRIRAAGYGVHPHLAIMAWDSYNADANATTVNYQYPDAIAVHSRDLYFSRAIAPGGATQAALTITPGLNEPLARGQILLVLSSSGERSTYAVVANNVAVGATVIPLAPPTGLASSPKGPPNDWFYIGGVDPALDLNDPVFDSGASVVKVDRYAFYVEAFDDDGNPASPRVPYLMMHRGLDLNSDGNIDGNDGAPIAVGVEQLQISLVLPETAGPTPVPQFAGVTVANPIRTPENWAALTPRPPMDDPYDAASRRANHPSNIKQVRISLVARSKLPTPESDGDAAIQPAAAWTRQSNGVTAWSQLENLTFPITAKEFDPTYNPSSAGQRSGFARAVMRIAVTPKNLMMRRQFRPAQDGRGG